MLAVGTDASPRVLLSSTLFSSALWGSVPASRTGVDYSRGTLPCRVPCSLAGWVSAIDRPVLPAIGARPGCFDLAVLPSASASSLYWLYDGMTGHGTYAGELARGGATTTSGSAAVVPLSAVRSLAHVGEADTGVASASQPAAGRRVDRPRLWLGIPWPGTVVADGGPRPPLAHARPAAGLPRTAPCRRLGPHRHALGLTPSSTCA